VVNFQNAFDHIDEFVIQSMKQYNTPGLILAITNKSQTIHLATYGYANLDSQSPITPDHLFQIGSITKIFTAIAIMQLNEGGQLDLHLPVTEYLPWFQVYSKYDPITPHHLLSHTAGIITGTDFTPMGARYCVWALRETETGFPPGSHFHYSNIGYWILGFLLEDVLGQSYNEIIQKQILKPLNMTNTAATITHHVYPRLAIGYQHLYDDRPFHVKHPLIPSPWVEVGSADGGIASTAEDMATFVRTILHRGKGLLSEENFDLLTQSIIEDPFYEGFHYGYSLTITEMDGHQIILSDGGMPGYLSSLQVDMDASFGVVVLMNGPGEAVAIGDFALHCLHAAQIGNPLPVIEPFPDPTYVENATEYVGTYTNPKNGKSLTFVVEAQRLILLFNSERISLELHGYDSFYVNHPIFDLHLLFFDRDKKGKVVEVSHGSDWYVNDSYDGPTSFDYPIEWDTYQGHYRSYNPWFTNFRIIIRKDRLFMGTTELVPLEGDTFRVGEDEQSPERLRFDTIVDGQVLRVNYSGCFYYRFFTP